MTALDRARGSALVGRDVAALNLVYLPGAAGRSVDTATIELLTARGWRVVGAQHVIDRVSVLPPEPTTPAVAAAGIPAGGPDGIRLEVVDRLPSYQVTDLAGGAVGRTAGRGAARRVIVLARTAAGYRIAAMQTA